ncbi:unnamed protein product [Schistocephalus solidus]|uniref:alanine--tRNA ligase n=1 Tax=Schistocephalus solidus TaxID=70667 RepID=A0A183T8I9_SCHSO|nr:unnamed protein product [Schistocephalus solidus]
MFNEELSLYRQYATLPSTSRHPIPGGECTVDHKLPFSRRVKLSPSIKKAICSSNDLRDEFLSFFQDRGHKIVAPSSVYPKRQEGSYFVNAGMNQFKELFLRTGDAESEFTRLRRAVDSQPCIRIGGRHDDLNDVGYDTYHHTMFEMLGNWSFGDYGKETACRQMWKFLTEVLGLPPKSLYVTYFGGCPELDLPADDETRDIWLTLGDSELLENQVGANHRFFFLPLVSAVFPILTPVSRTRACFSVSDQKLMAFGFDHNFWRADQAAGGGLCGPATEIHVDYRALSGTEDLNCARCLVNSGDPQVVELWNCVFITHRLLQDSLGKNSLLPLPNLNVDTGMGLERLASVMQGVMTTYDTDIYSPLVSLIETESKSITGSAPSTYQGHFHCPRPTSEDAIGASSPDAEASPGHFGSLIQSLFSRHKTQCEKKATTWKRQPVFAPLLRDVAYRVLADHSRALALALQDGLLPGRQGIQLKLRHLIYRASRAAVLCDLDSPEKPQLLGRLVAEIVRNASCVNRVFDVQGPSARRPAAVTPDQASDIISQELHEFVPRLMKMEAAFQTCLDEIGPGDSLTGHIEVEDVPLLVSTNPLSPRHYLLVIHPRLLLSTSFTDWVALATAAVGLVEDICLLEMEPFRLLTFYHLAEQVDRLLSGHYGAPISWDMLCAQARWYGLQPPPPPQPPSGRTPVDTARGSRKTTRVHRTPPITGAAVTALLAGLSASQVAVTNDYPKYAVNRVSECNEHNNKTAGHVTYVVQPILATLSAIIMPPSKLEASALPTIVHDPSLLTQTLSTLTNSADVFGMVFDSSNFFSPSGGQAGDTGHIICPISKNRRSGLTMHHTAQHLLNWAFAEELKPLQRPTQVSPDTATMDALSPQADSSGTFHYGSRVQPDRCYVKLTVLTGTPTEEAEDLTFLQDLICRVEERCRAVIAADLPINVKVMTWTEISEISSVRRYPWEVYPPSVRVVSIGDLVDVQLPQDSQHSAELCGGTHLQRTGDLEDIVVVAVRSRTRSIKEASYFPYGFCHHRNQFVAIAGSRAREARRYGSALLARIRSLETLSESAPADAELARQLQLLASDIDAVLGQHLSGHRHTVLPFLQRCEVEGSRARLPGLLGRVKASLKASGHDLLETELSHALSNTPADDANPLTMEFAFDKVNRVSYEQSDAGQSIA